MKSSSILSYTSRLAFLLSCGFSCAFGQVLDSNKREATAGDYVDKLPADKKDAIVVITGDKGSGTGFLAKMKGNVFLVTNMHVLNGQSSIKAKTMSGADLQITGFFGARDADIAILKLASVPAVYFETEESVNTTQKPGDMILIPGNSLGGGTILQTEGRIVAVGPVKIEHDAPTFHGNSGSPILSTSSWKVLGLDTESVTVSISDLGDQASVTNPNSQIKSQVRLFGYRLDTVSQWEAIDWARFTQQSRKLQDAEALVTSVHAVLKRDTKGWQKHPSTNSMMSGLSELVNKPRVSTADIAARVESVVLNLRNALKKVEQDALDSKQNCYGYISTQYQGVGAYARAIREYIDADKIR